MKSPSQLAESIERFQNVFWDKRCAGRPPVGVVNRDVFMPIHYLRDDPPRVELLPEDVGPELVMSDYEFGFAQTAVSCDDWMPFSAAWRAVPWLEACCGCSVRCASGSLAPGHCLTASDQLAEISIPAANTWFDRLRHETERLAASAPADCWISPTILRGPSDVIAAMRGMDQFYYDLHDDIRTIDSAAERVNRLFLDVLDMHFSAVGPKLGGYGNIYGYWAPDRTLVIQEDAMGMCSPAVFRDVFMKYNARIVEHLGQHVLFHLHSTGYRHYRHVLDIPGIAGLEITVEANGPSLAEMLPFLKEVLEESRLILMVEHGFQQLPAVLAKLPAEGLYAILNDKDVRCDEEFRRFVKANWKHLQN